MTRCLLEACPNNSIAMALEGGYTYTTSTRAPSAYKTSSLDLLDEPLDYEERPSAGALPEFFIRKAQSRPARLAKYVIIIFTLVGTTRHAVKAIKRSSKALERKGAAFVGATSCVISVIACLSRNERLLAWIHPQIKRRGKCGIMSESDCHSLVHCHHQSPLDQPLNRLLANKVYSRT